MRPRDPLAASEPGDNALPVTLDAGDLDARADCDPFTGEMAGQTGDEFGIVVRKDWPDVEHGDSRAQPAMSLRHFDPDRAAADDDQMVRAFTVGENCFVRQVGNVREPGNRRDGRVRAGRDDKAARPDFDVAGADRVGAREPRLATQYPDPKPLEPLDGIVRRDCRDDLLDTVGGRSKIDISPSRADAHGRP